MSDPDPPPIRWRLRLRASPAQVLAYLTEPGLVARWWAEAVRAEGGEVHLAFPDGGG
jgi:uncharacterized protein YndB with AHSA1/START domain